MPLKSSGLWPLLSQLWLPCWQSEHKDTQQQASPPRQGRSFQSFFLGVLSNVLLLPSFVIMEKQALVTSEEQGPGWFCTIGGCFFVCELIWRELCEYVCVKDCFTQKQFQIFCRKYLSLSCWSRHVYIQSRVYSREGTLVIAIGDVRKIIFIS